MYIYMLLLQSSVAPQRMGTPANLAPKTKTAMASLIGSVNSNQNAPLQHPLEATAQAIQGAVQGEGRAPRISHMGSANEGPADIIA